MKVRSKIENLEKTDAALDAVLSGKLVKRISVPKCGSLPIKFEDGVTLTVNLYLDDGEPVQSFALTTTNSVDEWH